MTPKEQQLAIAELLEFKKEVGCTGIIRWRKGDELFDKLPDHLNDLNAMHEAESDVLGDWGDYSALWHIYETHLKDICGLRNHWISATAAQRYKAFLKTFNLWTDDT